MHCLDVSSIYLLDIFQLRFLMCLCVLDSPLGVVLFLFFFISLVVLILLLLCEIFSLFFCSLFFRSIFSLSVSLSLI